MFRPLGWCLLVGSLSQLPASARADDDPNLDQARQKVVAGAELFGHGKYAEALDDFEEAHRLLPKNSRVYFNIAQALTKLDHRDQAAESFEQFLQGTADDPGVEDSKVDEARKAIKQARAAFAVVPLSIEGPGGTGRPASLQVHIVDTGQDRTTGSTFVYLPTKPDQHTLTVTADGMQPATFTISTEAPGIQPAHEVKLRGIRRDKGKDNEKEKDQEKDHPVNEHCRRLADACKAAGFVKGGIFAGKGLRQDCLVPLVAGKKVKGVKAEPADVAGCVLRKPDRDPPSPARDNR